LNYITDRHILANSILEIFSGAVRIAAENKIEELSCVDQFAPPIYLNFIISKEEKAMSTPNQDEQSRKTLVILTSDCVGKGNDALGSGIASNFVKTLKEMDDLWRLILLNGRVKLAADGSEVLSNHQEFAEQRRSILVCGKCLETFGLSEKKRVGDTANMLDVVTSMQVAEKVICFS